jgi:hypothetical protein
MVVNAAIKIQNSSSTLIDNDVHLLVIKSREWILNYRNYKKRIWLAKHNRSLKVAVQGRDLSTHPSSMHVYKHTNKDTTNEFMMHLHNENWQWVLSSHYVKSKLKKHMLRHCKSDFLTKAEEVVSENNEWTTKCIKILKQMYMYVCKQTRSFINGHCINNQIMKIYYNQYCQVLCH